MPRSSRGTQQKSRRESDFYFAGVQGLGLRLWVDSVRWGIQQKGVSYGQQKHKEWYSLQECLFRKSRGLKSKYVAMQARGRSCPRFGKKGEHLLDTDNTGEDEPQSTDSSSSPDSRRLCREARRPSQFFFKKNEKQDHEQCGKEFAMYYKNQVTTSGNMHHDQNFGSLGWDGANKGEKQRL